MVVGAVVCLNALLLQVSERIAGAEKRNVLRKLALHQRDGVVLIVGNSACGQLIGVEVDGVRR